jgi:hypothetical protein
VAHAALLIRRAPLGPAITLFEPLPSEPAGTYGPTTITFTNADTGQGTQTRTATLTVNAPVLQVTPNGNIVVAGNQGALPPSSFQDGGQIERKQRIVGHDGCGTRLIREATRWNNDLLRESAALRQSHRKNFQRSCTKWEVQISRSLHPEVP